MIRSRLWTLAALILAFGLVAAACGGDDDSGGDDEGTDGRGNIAISGSSTVEPISSLNAQAFAADNPGVAISVDGPGTGDGFKLFCSGETDISDASRAIKDSEAEDCAANGVTYTEIQIAIDGISVLTNPANTAVSCLTFGDLYAITGPESTGLNSWDAANDLAVEVGGNGGLPAAPLAITAPGEESGTYDTFVEFIIDDLAEERGIEPAAARPDYVASPNDNVIVEGIQGSDTSFGWVGYAFYAENTETLKAIEVDAGDGCVAPTSESIASGDYPLSRPLFIYVNNEKVAEKPELASFVEFYVNDGLSSVSEAGYVELADYSAVQAAVAALVGG